MKKIKIPLFPLNIVVFPYEKVPLHIFEPRYKKMISESIENETPFGIVLNNNGSVDSIGCSLNVTKVLKHYNNGEYDLIATGERCFQIIDKVKKDDLWIGNIEYMENPIIEDKKILTEVQNKYLELLVKLGKEENFDIYLERKISYQFLIGISLPLNLKRSILLLESERERLLYIYDLLDKILSQPIQNDEDIIPNA
jgi:Lon protease-like protein